MKTGNVADILGKKFKASVIQCNIKKDKMVCSGEKNPDFDKGMKSDWEIEANQFTGMGLRMTHLNKFTPLFDDMFSVMPGKKEHICMLRTGSGLGNVDLVCSEKESDLVEYHKHWFENPKEIREKGLKFKEF